MGRERAGTSSRRRGVGAADRRLASATRREDADEDGFALIESLVSMTLIAVIMAALGTYFVTITKNTNHARLSQVGVHVADTAVERVRGIAAATHDGAANAIAGRGATKVATQFGATYQNGLSLSPKVAPLLATMTQAVDNGVSVNAGDSAILPTAPVPQTINGQVFNVNYYVGLCKRPTAQKGGECTRTATGATVTYVRVAVVVAWKSIGCPVYGCVTASATLLNGDVDPIFNFNAQPPDGPTITAVPQQNSNVGDVIAGLTGVTCTTAPCPPQVPTGVLPMTFVSSGLPDGLEMNPATGVITGSIAADPAGRLSCTDTVPAALPPLTCTVGLTVTDAFLRAKSATFSWRVYGPITAAPDPVPNQASQVNAAVTTSNALAFAADGGSGPANLSWTVTGLPTGLCLAETVGSTCAGATGTDYNGVVRGTPTASGTYSVTLTVKDGVTGSQRQFPFTWTVGTLVIAPPSAKVSTVGVGDSVALSAAGTLGTYTWQIVSFLDSAGQPPSQPVGDQPVITGSGQNATISWPSPVAGTGTYTVTVRTQVGAATTTATFTWSVFPAPQWTDTPGTTQQTTVGVGVNLPFQYSCPSASCTFSVTTDPGPKPSWLGSSVASATTTTGSVALRSSTPPSAPGAWAVTYRLKQGSYSADYTVQLTVFAAPSIDPPFATRVSAYDANETVYFDVECPNLPCDSFELQARGGADPVPSWLEVDLGNITQPTPGSYHVPVVATGPGGTCAITCIKITDLTLHVKDAAAVEVDSPPLTWYFTSDPSVGYSSPVVLYDGGALTSAPTGQCLAGGCWYAYSGTLPGWLNFDDATGTFSATNAAAGTWSTTVTVTDRLGRTDTADLQVNVYPDLAITGTTPLTGMTPGTAARTFTATGGTSNASDYLWDFQTAPPAGSGITLTASGASVVVTGTPVSGTYTFTLRLRSSVTGSGYADAVLPVTWFATNGSWISASDATSDSGATVNQAVSYYCSAAANTNSTYRQCRFGISGGPANLGLYQCTANCSSAASWTAITGTTNVATNAQVRLQGTNVTGAGPYTVTITISPRSNTGTYPGPSVPYTLVWTIYTTPTIALPGTLTPLRGVAYSYALTYTCYAAPCAFTVANGTLPAGLTLNADGQITGTATTAGTSTGIRIKITDARNATATMSSAGFSIVVWTGLLYNVDGANYAGYASPNVVSTTNTSTPNAQFVFNADGTIGVVGAGTAKCLVAPTVDDGTVSVAACNAASATQIWAFQTTGRIANTQGTVTRYLRQAANTGGILTARNSSNNPLTRTVWSLR